jgi:hypothetical protein
MCNHGRHPVTRLRHADGCGSLTKRNTFWVDARTYIPLQAVTADTGPRPFTETARYRVLPATSANLGLLTVPVPAGFTRTTRPPDFSAP